MAPILSHPFRLGSNGQVVTVDQDTETADREQVAVLALTVVGERPMTPGFGVTDPAFGGYLPAELAAGVQAFGPDVSITAVTATPFDESTQVAHIEFE